MGDGPLFRLLQENNKTATSKTGTIFQNMMKFVPRGYLPFDEAYLRHSKFGVHTQLSLELQHAVQFSDAS